MRFKFLTMLAAVALLAACETAPESTGNTGSSGASSNNSSAPAAVQIQGGSSKRGLGRQRRRPCVLCVRQFGSGC